MCILLTIFITIKYQTLFLKTKGNSDGGIWEYLSVVFPPHTLSSH